MGRPDNKEAANLAVCQPWLESERGWGTSPDGISLHETEESRERFIADYWDSMPDSVPEIYSRPNGAAIVVRVSAELYAEVVESDYGIRTGEGIDGILGRVSTAELMELAQDA